MAYRITYNSNGTEDVDADAFENKGPWVVFRKLVPTQYGAPRWEQVLQVKSASIRRVEQVSD